MRFAIAALALVACDTVDDRPDTWSYIHAAIIEPSCATANCHSAISRTAGIDLSDREQSYVFVVGRLCTTSMGLPVGPGNYAFPFHPERSPLLHLLRGDADRIMPPDTPLPDPEIELVERWILDGARCD